MNLFTHTPSPQAMRRQFQAWSSSDSPEQRPHAHEPRHPPLSPAPTLPHLSEAAAAADDAVQAEHEPALPGAAGACVAQYALVHALFSIPATRGSCSQR